MSESAPTKEERDAGFRFSMEVIQYSRGFIGAQLRGMTNGTAVVLKIGIPESQKN